MSHFTPRPDLTQHDMAVDPSPQTTDSIAREKARNYASFKHVVADQLYIHYHQHHPLPLNQTVPHFFDAPQEVQRRFEFAAAIIVGFVDPTREAMARHTGRRNAAASLASATDVVTDQDAERAFNNGLTAYLDYLSRAGLAPVVDPVDPRRI